jgi:hypothetical protein
MSQFIVSFESHATKIVRARIVANKAEAKFSDVVSASINAFIDAVRKAGIEPDEKSCKALAVELSGCQTVVDAIASGLFEAKTFSEYARGAERAFFHGVPWSASLKNDPAKGLPWSKPRGPKGKAKPATTAAAALPEAPDMGTASTDEIRKFVQGYAKTLESYLNKHLKNADLQTRDAVQHFVRAVAKLN